MTVTCKNTKYQAGRKNSNIKCDLSKGLHLMQARKISLVDHVWIQLLIIKAILGNNMTDRHTGRDAAFRPTTPMVAA